MSTHRHLLYPPSQLTPLGREQNREGCRREERSGERHPGEERGGPISFLTAFRCDYSCGGGWTAPAVGRKHPSSGPWWEREGRSLCQSGWGGRMKAHSRAAQSPTCPAGSHQFLKAALGRLGSLRQYSPSTSLSKSTSQALRLQDSSSAQPLGCHKTVKHP